MTTKSRLKSAANAARLLVAVILVIPAALVVVLGVAIGCGTAEASRTFHDLLW